MPMVSGNGRPLGRHVEHDEESRRYAHQASGRTLVSVHHVRRIPVLDQGDLGSCTGNAMCGAAGTSPLLEALPVPAPVLDEAFAVHFLYHMATEFDDVNGTYPPDDTGSSGLAVAKAAKQLGLISGYRHAFSAADALDALQDGPIIIGIDWYEGFDSPDANGLVSISGSVRGGHEIVVDEFDAEHGVVGLTNSWGAGWGVNGRFFMSVATFTKLLAADGDATVLVPANVAPPVPHPPTPDPGAASFPGASDLVDRHIHQVAAREGLTVTAYQEKRWRHWFRFADDA